jgi:hypothetical protein
VYAVCATPNSAGVPECLLPRPEALVGHAVGTVPVPASVGEEPEGKRTGKIAGVDGQIASVGARCRARAPQKPPADAALVLGLLAADVIAEVQE